MKKQKIQAQEATFTTRPTLAVLHPQKQKLFADVAHRLGEALADCYDNAECPPYIRKHIELFHRAIVSEFNIETGGDIRLRFGLAARLSQMGNRPA
jgi:hypothetical protein